MQVDIRDPASIPGSGRSPGGAHGNSLQNPCLENPMDRGSWWATVHGVAKSQTQLKRLRGCAHTHTHTPPRQFTDCGLRYSLQSFWEKLSWNSGLRGRLQVRHTFRNLWNCSQGTQAADAFCVSPLPCPSSPVSTRKEQMNSSGALISVTSTQGQLQIVWFWWTTELILTVLWDCIYLHTLKSWCLRDWLPVSLNLCEEILQCKTLTGLSTSSNTGS